MHHNDVIIVERGMYPCSVKSADNRRGGRGGATLGGTSTIVTNSVVADTVTDAVTDIFTVGIGVVVVAVIDDTSSATGWGLVCRRGGGC